MPTLAPAPAPPHAPGQGKPAAPFTEPFELTVGRERRKFRRVAVAPMYSAAAVRVLSQKRDPLDGHVRNVSESGMSVELDELVPVGAAVTVEFSFTGLGRTHRGAWPTFATAAEVVRHEAVEDFPHGPYQVGLRFARMGTMTRAQIARYVAAAR